MLTRTESSEVSSLEVMGYAAFCGRLDDDPQFAKWFDRLRTAVAPEARLPAERGPLPQLQP
ncbi:hypothetical protein JD77_03625 [Micromonospora olivasterospora]|uniref:Uncharacterized protein n=1 Tax=Micromonospora olivasterospora TaxID=1880 RepID=A0A562ICW4_MICOL|nr:hypothetical protein JD77_03625 [Micromonospora olivasterospora]